MFEPTGNFISCFFVQICDRFCLQEEIMRRCDCFHPQMDMTLLNVSKFDFKERQRPCNLLDGGEEKTRKVFLCTDHPFPGKFILSELNFCSGRGMHS